ncbi:MAG: retropepsin-like domain-containing protein, partial [Alistipes sp.]|nr:retropepsin-like domain-containing protein [Alistipes sp.]
MRRSIVSAAVACVLLAACGGAEHPAAGTSSVSEPLPPGAIAFDYDSHLYFDALVADSLPARLVFDTGAVQLSLDSLWFERHAGAFDGMRIGCAVMRGAGQQAEVARMLLDSLAFGIDTLRWQSSMPVIHDLKKILGRKIDGIFGQQFLDGRCVAFDYRRGSMRAVSPDTLAAAGYRRIPARKEGCRIYFPMRIRFDAGHTVEGDFLLDTGCGLAAIVATAAADKAGLELMEGMKLPYETASGGVGGRAESYVCRAAEVALGEYTLRDVVVEVSRNGTGFLASKEAD